MRTFLVLEVCFLVHAHFLCLFLTFVAIHPPPSFHSLLNGGKRRRRNTTLPVASGVLDRLIILNFAFESSCIHHHASISKEEMKWMSLLFQKDERMVCSYMRREWRTRVRDLFTIRALVSRLRPVHACILFRYNLVCTTSSLPYSLSLSPFFQRLVDAYVCCCCCSNPYILQPAATVESSKSVVVLVFLFVPHLSGIALRTKRK